MESATDPKSTREVSLWYPRDHLLGTLPGRDDAEKALNALVEAGFDRADLALLHPEDVDEHVRRAEGRRGFFKTFLAAWDHLSSDEGGAMRRYQRAAADGLESITVYAPRKDGAREAASILRAHGAHEIWYYGRWTVEEL